MIVGTDILETQTQTQTHMPALATAHATEEKIIGFFNDSLHFLSKTASPVLISIVDMPKHAEAKMSLQTYPLHTSPFITHPFT